MYDLLKGRKASNYRGVLQLILVMIGVFRHFQQASTEAPVFILFDPNNLICLETNSSEFTSVGNILQLAYSNWVLNAMLFAPGWG